MKIFRNSLTTLLILVTASMITLVGCGQEEATNAEGEKTTQSSKASDSSIALKVGSQTLTMQQFNQQLDQQMSRIKRRLKQLPKSKQKKQLDRYRQRFKQQLARQQETKLTLQHFVSQADISVPDSEIEQQMNKLKKNFPSKQAMKKALKKQGKSIDSLRERIRDQKKTQKFLEQKAGEISVSPEEAKNYFEENKEQFKQSEEVKARHILLKGDTDAREKIKDLKDKLDKGSDFAELARKESEGPSSKKGGSLGYITRDRMVKPFSDAAFSLSKGEISSPVKTQYGWHLIKVDDRKEAESANYDDVSDTVMQQVKTQKRREKYQQVIQDLKSQVDITNNVVSRQPAKKKPASPMGSQ